MSKDALAQWAEVLAKEYDASIRHVKGGYRLESASDEWEELTGSKSPIALSYKPESISSWRTRLRFVEKAAARALTSAPLAFSTRCTVGKQQRNIAGETDVARLAFGFSLSLGRSSRQRHTAYYVSSQKKALHILGEDQLFDHVQEVTYLDLKSSIVKEALKPILTVASEAQADYIGSHVVMSQLTELRDKVSKELRDLDRLYTVNYGQYAQLLGRNPAGLRGDDAIEAEYVNRMEDILLKYQPGVLFEPLTLAVVRCRIRKRKRGTVTEIALPFLEDRWLRME